MFARLAYFVVLLAACSCQTNTPTDPTKPKNISGIFWRYFPNDVENFKDASLDKGVDLLELVTFDKNLKTVIFVEGWQQNANSPAPQQLVEAYLTNLNTNQLIFDWSNINTDLNYESVASQVEKVGTALGKQLCKMFAAGLDPSKTELIGVSLGAHVAGQAGNTIKKMCKHSCRRIIALDAIFQQFYPPRATYRPINKDDADHTVAIHTSGRQFGVFNPIATVDFYPNSGKVIQPGCGPLGFYSYCSHERSWQYFVESLYYPKGFRAAKADTYTDFRRQSCEENAKQEPVYIGDDEYSANGIYYLITNSKSDFGKGDEGLCT